MFDNWLARHRHPTSFILHLVGIPQTVAAGIVAILAGTGGAKWLWILAAGLFVCGYALQLIGHWIEGNDPGEVIIIKRILGKPYKALSDQVTKTRGLNNERS